MTKIFSLKIETILQYYKLNGTIKGEVRTEKPRIVDKTWNAKMGLGLDVDMSLMRDLGKYSSDQEMTKILCKVNQPCVM